MREIKFRVWHEGAKEMLYEDNLGDVFRWKIEGQPIKIMEYIGLKDKNGEEIYEADILQIETKDRQIIEILCEYGIARRVMASGWEVDIPSFYFERSDGLKSFPIVYNWQRKHDLEIMEIIGNVHENPELLKN